MYYSLFVLNLIPFKNALQKNLKKLLPTLNAFILTLSVSHLDAYGVV